MSFLLRRKLHWFYIQNCVRKKCSKYNNVAFYEYYFIGKISRTTYHRNVIDPSLESRKFPPYCGYVLKTIISIMLLQLDSNLEPLTS